ncbi:ribosomal RNA small subunit methyltransferase G [Acidisoma sp. 7E03]
MPPEIEERLRLYAALLSRWNQTIRLVSTQDAASLWTRHIADSLQLLPFLTEDVTAAVDLGSGGGLPGLVLAIASGIPFDLVEADGRKAAFLREAAQATAAPVTVHASRIETVRLPSRPFVTARALAPLSRLLAFAAPLLEPGGTCVFPKGESYEAELAEARQSWAMSLDIVPSQTAPEARLLVIRNLEPLRVQA